MKAGTTGARIGSHFLPRYAFAFLCSGIALIFTFLLKPIFAHGIFSLFLVGVVASAWVGGLTQPHPHRYATLTYR